MHHEFHRTHTHTHQRIDVCSSKWSNVYSVFSFMYESKWGKTLSIELSIGKSIPYCIGLIDFGLYYAAAQDVPHFSLNFAYVSNHFHTDGFWYLS